MQGHFNVLDSLEDDTSALAPFIPGGFSSLITAENPYFEVMPNREIHENKHAQIYPFTFPEDSGLEPLTLYLIECD